jgi:hypothetical protein
MLVLSLNVRGIGGTLKSAAFRKLLENSSPDIILLQETLSTDISPELLSTPFAPPGSQRLLALLATREACLWHGTPDFLTWCHF